MHFSLLVIGKDLHQEGVLDELLAPYQDSSFAGINTPFVKSVDVTAKSLQEYADYQAGKTLKSYILPTIKDYFDNYLCFESVDINDPIDLEDEACGGYAFFKGDEFVKAIERANPNGKWDYWVLGGRCTGMLIAKKNDTEKKTNFWLNLWPKMGKTSKQDIGDNCLKFASVDWEAMHKLRLKQRLKEWQVAKDESQTKIDNVIKLTANLNETRYYLLNEIATLQTKFQKTNPDCSYGELQNFIEANLKYPQTYYQAFLNHVGSSYLYCDIEDWIKAAPKLTSFALLDESGWHEFDDRPNYSLAKKTKNGKDWQDFIDQRLQDMGNDEWIAIIDCHN